MKMTLKELLNDKNFRRADGALNDAALAVYRAASESHRDKFVPDDELDLIVVEVSAPFYLNAETIAEMDRCRASWPKTGNADLSAENECHRLAVIRPDEVQG